MDRLSSKLSAFALIASILALTLSACGAAELPRSRVVTSRPSLTSRINATATVKSLGVLSYNVEGLPAPVRFGRSKALSRIGYELAVMRETGRQPNVVLLQEAFAAPAKEIAGEAGYRYLADGPSAAQVNSVRAPADAADFVANASHLRGEDDGKWADSGLRILSDFPIVKVQRLAFPSWACAGYDCLANKGVLIAWIKIPGDSRPVAFIDTHLNSRRASGVAVQRADRAYELQIATLRRFIADNVPGDAAAFLGGDFNNGKAKARWAALSHPLLISGRNSLLDALGNRSAVTLANLTDANAILQRHKDWLFYRGAQSFPVTLTGFDVPFGRQPDGYALSDHLGYEAHYRIGAIGHSRPV